MAGLLRSATAGMPSPIQAIVQSGLSSGGRPLDAGTRKLMESRFGRDFATVRVHTGEQASTSAAALGARAYTVGHDVAFARGAFAPEAPDGRWLLAHELSHVVQQEGDDGTTTQGDAPLYVDDPDGAQEREADSAADTVLARGLPHGQLQQMRTPRGAPAHVARKADPARVAHMDQAAIRADPDYIENGLVRMEFFSAEQARLHYSDGASLLIGLVPRWIQPPLETVDYHTAATDYARVDGGHELKFIKDPMHLPAEGMTFEEVLKTFTTTVRFTVDPHSGKIVPNHLNAVTAPFLCSWLKQAEEQYIREFDAMAEGMVKILKVQKLIIELMLMRATIPGPKAPTPAAGGAGVAGAELTAAKVGERIIGWGTGQTAEAVAQTQAVTRSLTTEAIEGMIKRGLTREWVADQLAMYERAVATGGAKLKNAQLLPRLELMKRLLELWPK